MVAAGLAPAVASRCKGIVAAVFSACLAWALAGRSVAAAWLAPGSAWLSWLFWPLPVPGWLALAGAGLGCCLAVLPASWLAVVLAAGLLLLCAL